MKTRRIGHNLTIALLVLLSSIGLICSGCSLQQATPTIVDMTLCDDGQRIEVDQYVLINNVWNKGDITDYTECVFTQAGPPATMGWHWDWPGKDRLIKAYPEVMLGDSPWDDSAPTGKLPVPVTTQDIVVSYDATLETTGSWNLALELWLTDALPPAESNITHEVMFWLDAGDLSPGPASSDIVDIDGVKYSVHISHNHGDASGGSNASWSYIVFYSRQPQHAATLDLSQFLAYLLEQDIIEDNLYIATVELGTEIASGSGEFVLNSYKVSIP